MDIPSHTLVVRAKGDTDMAKIAAGKKVAQTNPASIVNAALDKVNPVNGYRKVPVEGTLGRVHIVRAPDGRTFSQWNNSKNPKGSLSFASVARLTALKADIDMLIKAAEVAESINGTQPERGTTLAEVNGVKL